MKYITELNTSRLGGWVRIYKGFSSSIYLEKAGYFDERPEINTGITQLIVLVIMPLLISFYSWWFILLFPFIFFGYGRTYISLPIKTGIQDCDSAAWGFNYHDNKIWIYIGGGGNFEGGKKWKTIEMPWHLKLIRTSLLVNKEINDAVFELDILTDSDWEHETKGNRKEFYKDEWKEKAYVQHYDYKDDDGSLVPCTITVEQREWRMKWLQWTRLFNKVRTSIDIKFSKEVGKEKGSWKGGVIGCSYELLPYETPLECIKRMQNEREL